jgi:NADP-dependent 3-hydroxy acid dehydrogenase YdfG
MGAQVPSNMQASGPWAGKVVLITGASSGIGASCGTLIGALGARLALTALPGDGFESGESDSTIRVAGDIASAQTRAEIVDRAIARFGRIDVLINNAGVGQYGYPTEVDTEISKRMFDINVFAPLALAQLVIPHMRAQKSGTIVNIGSVGGKVSLPWAVMYCATKWALHCVEDIRRLVSPDQVAAGLIRGVERHRRTVFVPKIGFIFTSLDFFAPRVMDWYIRGKM